MTEKLILYPQLVKRYQEAVEDHRHAVSLLAGRDAEIGRLRDLLANSRRQNRRLSRESRELAERIRELNPDDQALLEILYPKD